MATLTKEQWQEFCLQNPEHSLLQDGEWGELKSGFGWTPSFVRSGAAGAMVLFRSLLGLFADEDRQHRDAAHGKRCGAHAEMGRRCRAV